MRNQLTDDDREKADEQLEELKSKAVDLPCGACGGKGYRPGDVCSVCGGSGKAKAKPLSE